MAPTLSQLNPEHLQKLNIQQLQLLIILRGVTL